MGPAKMGQPDYLWLRNQVMGPPSVWNGIIPASQ